MVEFTRRNLMASSVAAAISTGAVGVAGAQDGPNEHETLDAVHRGEYQAVLDDGSRRGGHGPVRLRDG